MRKARVASSGKFFIGTLIIEQGGISHKQNLSSTSNEWSNFIEPAILEISRNFQEFGSITVPHSLQ
jgi:hypothetical protein